MGVVRKLQKKNRKVLDIKCHCVFIVYQSRERNVTDSLKQSLISLKELIMETKKVFFTMFILTMSLLMHAQTYVSGHWRSGSHHRFTGDVIVQQGNVLHIDGSVTIEIHDGQLIVEGYLFAGDLSGDRTFFVPQNNRDGWGGIVFRGVRHSYLHNVDISYVIDNCAVLIEQNSSHINIIGSNIHRNVTRIVNAQNAAPGISLFDSSDILIQGNEIFNNRSLAHNHGVAISIKNSVDITINRNNIFNNTGYNGAIYNHTRSQRYLAGNIDIIENTIENNSLRETGAITVFSGIAPGFHLHEVYVHIEKNSIAHNFVEVPNPLFTFMGGAGIYTDISKTSIFSNSILYNKTSDNGYGGGIAVIGSENEPLGALQIADNTLRYNYATRGGGIAMHIHSYDDGLSTQYLVFLSGNDIVANEARYGGGVYLDGNHQGTSLSNDHIAFNEATHGGGGIYYSNYYKYSGPLYIRTSNIVYNRSEDVGPGFMGLSRATLQTVNSIYWGNHRINTELDVWRHGIQIVCHSDVDISHSCVQDGLQGISSFHLTHLNVYSVYPEFADPFSGNFFLSNPNNILVNGGATIFPPQPWVGAFPYDQTRLPGTFTLRLDTTTNMGLNFVSFPRIARGTNPTLAGPPWGNPDGNPDEPRSFLPVANTLLPEATSIMYRDQSVVRMFDPASQTWFWNMNNNPPTEIKSSQGYMVNSMGAKNITFRGPLMNPWNTIHLEQRESWVGFYLQGTHLIRQAFSNDFLNQLIRIDGNGWTATSANGWSNLDNKTISQGEMIVIRRSSSTGTPRFRWRGAPVRGSHTVQHAQYFEFERTGQFGVFVVNYETVDQPLEIAVYVNGKCKGASPYEGDYTHILAYLNESDLFGHVSFKAIYPDGRVETIHDYALFSLDNDELIYERVALDDLYGTYFVRFTSNERNSEIIIPFARLDQNFPNPFNPVTAIEFYISHDDVVQLSIYNIKGQKVKDIASGKMSAGRHTLTWEGVDSSGKPVSSGIYFYKLTTNQGTEIRRMALIK
jgi:hypothetical protein